MTRSRTMIDEGKTQLRAFLQTPEGRAAVVFLRSFTVEAVAGPEMAEAALRFHGGKCALVKQLESLADEKDGTDD